MNLKQLEAFVCVAENKNFSQAAKALYLTQPTISAHIHSLEKELGCTLFIRTTKDVKLSGDGELLYSEARQMMVLERKIRRKFEEKDTSDSKHIKLGTSTIPGQYILPKTLSAFMKAYPDYQLEVVENDSMGIIQMVLDGEIHVGFTGTKTENTAIVFDAFFKDQLVLITPNLPRYQAYGKTPFPLEELYKERLIVREEGSGTRKESERYLAGTGIDLKRLSIVATMSNQETIKKSVGSGMGISMISSAAAMEYAEQGRILQFPLPKADEGYRNLYMAWSRNRKPDLAVRTLIEFVRKTQHSLYPDGHLVNTGLAGGRTACDKV